jgi:excisionase family DNA binding protein
LNETTPNTLNAYPIPAYQAPARWASLQQAERHARVTNGTIRAAVKRGEIPGYKRPGGKGVLVDLNDVDAWIKTTWKSGANESARPLV